VGDAVNIEITSYISFRESVIRGSGRAREDGSTEGTRGSVKRRRFEVSSSLPAGEDNGLDLRELSPVWIRLRVRLQCKKDKGEHTVQMILFQTVISEPAFVCFGSSEVKLLVEA
jgi:hypothetical protein